VHCNTCEATAWKLKTNEHTKVGKLPSKGGLFDLMTNPEEDAGLDCAANIAASNHTLAGVFCDLDQRVQEWNCCSEKDDPQSCEVLQVPKCMTAPCDARCNGHSGCP
jgi:hypothetical protein